MWAAAQEFSEPKIQRPRRTQPNPPQVRNQPAAPLTPPAPRPPPPSPNASKTSSTKVMPLVTGESLPKLKTRTRKFSNSNHATRAQLTAWVTFTPISNVGTTRKQLTGIQ